MGKRSFHRGMLYGWRTVQFEIFSLVLVVLGIWLAWKLSHDRIVGSWIVYLVVLWSIALVLHLLRILYLVRSKGRK